MGLNRTPRPSTFSPPAASVPTDQPYGLSDQGWPYCPWPCATVSPTALIDEWSEDSLHHLTQEAVRQQRYGGALLLLDYLIERCPHQASYYNNRGLVHFWCRHYVTALADFDHALQIDPSLDQAYNNRANAYAALGAFPQAIADYERALEHNPFNTRARLNLGITWRDLGQLDRALVCLDEALLFYQLTEHIYAERGRTYHRRGDWNCALADYQRCLGLLANRPDPSASVSLQTRVQGWIDELLPSDR